MKHIDPVMKELWAVKDANAAQHGNATAYIAFLRKAEIRERRAGRTLVPVTHEPTREPA
jgi:hypothetical protein